MSLLSAWNRQENSKYCRKKLSIFSDKKFSFLILVNCNELIVLSSPKSVEFKGESELPAESLSDVLSATLGYSIDGLQSFDGLYMNDPFNTAKSVVSVVVEGVDSLNFQVCFKNREMFRDNKKIFFFSSSRDCRTQSHSILLATN